VSRLEREDEEKTGGERTRKKTPSSSRALLAGGDVRVRSRGNIAGRNKGADPSSREREGKRAALERRI